MQRYVHTRSEHVKHPFTDMKRALLLEREEDVPPSDKFVWERGDVRFVDVPLEEKYAADPEADRYLRTKTIWNPRTKQRVSYGYVLKNKSKVPQTIYTAVLRIYHAKFGFVHKPLEPLPSELDAEHLPQTWKGSGDVDRVVPHLIQKQTALAKTVSTGQKFALNAYVNGFASDLNNVLRHPEAWASMTPYGKKNTEAYLKAIDACFKEKATRLDYPLAVYRGVRPKHAQEWTVGREFIDNGYVSTSLDPNIARKFGKVMVRLVLPKGFRALYLNTVTDTKFPYEHEMLLPRGQTFKVVSRKDQPSGATLITVVPSEPTSAKASVPSTST